MILLIDNYDSFTFNLAQCIEKMGFPCRVVRNDAITIEEISKLNPEAIVLSPGPGAPSSAGITLDVIRNLSGKFPILGVCLGHQSIGEAFGAKVIRAKRPKHGKISEVFHNGQNLFCGLPSPFRAARYHSLVVDRSTLPENLEITAETSDHTIMGIRHKTLPVEGVQFHPESIATEGGEKLIENFLKRRIS